MSTPTFPLNLTPALPSPTQKSGESDTEQFAAKVASSLNIDGERYRKGVETLMRLRARTVISNGKSLHAAILFEKFFEHAERKIRIFCRNLNPKVFDREEVITQAIKAASKGVDISVITQEVPVADSRFLAALNRKPFKFSVRLATGEAATAKANFAVMDAQSVRVEPNRDAFVAQAVMYDPSYAKELVESFDYVFACESEELPQMAAVA